ncbi:MAG: glycosyltransferase family 2 protein [Firmicutes bacterium]|nr:glycosyltransferase family 2 protein [Bacillota bacterium]
MEGKALSKKLVAVPVYNEEPSVEKVLNAIVEYAGSAEILVIDDGSTDRSRQILYQFDGIHLIRHPQNYGYGQSLIDAFAYASAHGYEAVVTIDCDEQHEPQQIPEFFAKLAEGWDIVSGSRYLEDVEPVGTVPRDRLKINRLITAKINELTAYNLTDSFCGMKAYRTAAIQKLNLTEPGYAFPLQVWLQAFKAGLTVTELPVPLVYMDHFERSFGGSLDDPQKRLRYYWQVIEEETKDWN